MVHPPVDRNGVEATAGESSRSIPTPFLTKTYQLVDDPALDEIISWNEDGSAFVVRNPTDFARDLLPKYFKHNNFSSFVRQLNTYGFRKLVSDRWEFSNECFRKDERSLLGDIHRRRVGAAAVLLPKTPVPVPMVVAVVPEEVPIPRHSVSGTDSGEDQVISSTYSPGVVLREGAVSGGGSGSGSTVDLIGENDRLRKDNLQLNKELCHMKSMCNNIYSLMSNYSNNCDNSSKVSESVDNQIPMEALDLMPAGQYCTEADETNTGGMVVDERNAKLFGVSIGMKRRMEEEEEGEEDTDGVAEHSKVVEIKQLEKMIKIEVLDDDEDDDYNNDNQKSPCVTLNKQNRSFRPDFYS